MTSTWRDRARGFFGSGWFWLAVALIVPIWPITYSMRIKLPPAPPVLGTLAPFQGADQRGMPFGTPELTDHIWVLQLFSPLEGEPARARVQRLYKVQHRGRNLAPLFHLVSASTDDVDAQALTAFTQGLRTSPRMWTFASGTAPLRPGLLDAWAKTGAKDAGDVLSGRVVALIDERGRVRAFYDLEAPGGVQELLLTAGLLINRPGMDVAPDEDRPDRPRPQ